MRLSAMTMMTREHLRCNSVFNAFRKSEEFLTWKKQRVPYDAELTNKLGCSAKWRREASSISECYHLCIPRWWHANLFIIVAVCSVAWQNNVRGFTRVSVSSIWRIRVGLMFWGMIRWLQAQQWFFVLPLVTGEQWLLGSRKKWYWV